MRMWMIEPKQLCKKHLLGEHGEIHKHRHNFVKKHNINGRVFPVAQIEPLSMKSRHDELADELISRGFNHNSPYSMPDLSYLSPDLLNVKVNIDNSIADLKCRCNNCLTERF